jgi:hypothetical protein
MHYGTGIKHLDWSKHYKVAWAGQKRIRRRVHVDTRKPNILTQFKFIYSILDNFLDFGDLSRLKRLCKQSRQWVQLDRDKAVGNHSCNGCHRITKAQCSSLSHDWAWYHFHMHWLRHSSAKYTVLPVDNIDIGNELQIHSRNRKPRRKNQHLTLANNKPKSVRLTDRKNRKPQSHMKSHR